MPKIYDNIELHLTEGLKSYIGASKRTDFCVGYFNLRGWKEVAESVDKLQGDSVTERNGTHHRYCRLLVGMQKDEERVLRESFFKTSAIELVDNAKIKEQKLQLAQKFKDQLTYGVPTDADEKALRKLSIQLKEKKLVVKLFLKHQLHAKLYLAYRQDVASPIIGFVGSSNLTFSGLVKQGELNVDVVEQDAANKLSFWFDERWNDRACIDISEELIEIIDNSWAGDRLISPYYVYLKMAYHLSQEARAGLVEYRISKQFQKELLPFQQNAVKIAAHHLHKRNGVMIGDVVGLGKTITACAVAKIFEEDFYFSTLIICPPNLQAMWHSYIDRYDMKANVLSSGKVIHDLKKLRRFKLVIIDESHNLRNSSGSRYRAIKEYLLENESKVILLSATPFNKSYLDLAAQLELFIPDDYDLGISPEQYISDIGGAINFATRHTETFIRSIKAFEKSSFPEDWHELMRMYLVRRTRSFIKEHYATLDETNGRRFLTFFDGTRSYFPDRLPQKVEYGFRPDDPTDQYAKLYSDKVVRMINSLNLPRYGLANYVVLQPTVEATPDEIRILGNLTRAGRRLMGFCRTNLFKRLESSGHAFLLSLSRHVLRNSIVIYAIQNNLPIPIGKAIVDNFDDYLEDEDQETEADNQTDKIGEETNQVDSKGKLLLDIEKYNEKAQKLYEVYHTTLHKKFDWIRPDFFAKILITNLISDAKELIEILKIAKDWQPEEDRQLNALHELLTVKHGKEKVLVFTQFADTAYYLYENLKARGVEQMDCVSGKSENPTASAQRFSPASNKMSDVISGSQEFRVLITTDVLSEGQNLQDAHIILNYDLPWAIIRLVQRAGRVDRIGQKAEQILCYSFLPEDGLEQIINLRRRLTDRLRQNAEVVGSDEVFFDGDHINISDLYSEKSGILDEDEGEVDLASYAYQIWNDALKNDPTLEQTIVNMPNVSYATKKHERGIILHSNVELLPADGVIVYTRTAEENDVLTWLDAQGNVLTQSQLAILKAAQCQPDTPAEYRLPNHHELVEQSMAFIQEEESRTFAGTLGKKSGVRYRTYMRLNNLYQQTAGTLFANDALKRAIDDIYNFTLREFARETINRQLKSGISDDDLARLVISLREENKLVIHNPEEDIHRHAQIICSMGLRK
jgi:superfamily II DNA or RNA helicase